MNIKTLTLLSLLALTMVGCATQRGIPNYVKVNNVVSRGGQPDRMGWRTLKWDGVDTVIKLNSGRDTEAERLGMRVVYIPISTYEQTLGTPERWKIEQALFEMERAQLQGHKVFVHCTHGQDRTGLIVGVYQYRGGMAKDAAYAEMKELGFHPLLRGLYRAWEAAER